MSTQRPRLTLQIPPQKHELEPSSPGLKFTCAGGGSGTLSPDLQPNTPPTFPQHHGCLRALKIGRYVLVDQVDTVQLQSGISLKIYKAIHMQTQADYICKVIPIEKYRETLSAYWQVGYHENINEIEEVLLGDTQAYVFFARHYGDLHSYIRSKRKLRESEAMRLYRQIVSAVGFCHENGVVLRDLKLRKFVFKNGERTQLKLEGLEDACVLMDEGDDSLADKHGCPAYVSPEILNTTDSYSGRAADTWSLGVILYTMLIGRYPFHDTDAGALFGKIRRGQYSIPETISSRAKCLVRSLLRRDPCERLSAEQILQHPWFSAVSARVGMATKADRDRDQAVPDWGGEVEEPCV